MKSTETIHIFYKHLLPRQHNLPLLKPKSSEIWPSVFLLLCLALLVLIKAKAFSRVVKVIQAAYNVQVLQQLEREETGQIKLYPVLLSVFFALNLSFLIYKSNLAYQLVMPQEAHLKQLSVFALIVILFFLFRLLSNRLISLFTGEARLISSYETSVTLINQALGLLLFPWIILAELSKINPLIFISGALITFLAGTLMRWYKGVVICLIDGQVGLLQIFLYFCGLEILPLAITVKYVIETF